MPITAGAAIRSIRIIPLSVGLLPIVCLIGSRKCTLTGFALIWRRSWRVENRGNCSAVRPLFGPIESDPVLAATKIIAEAWDAAGLYQVGSFIGDRFSEWNGQFRDDVRRFMRGDDQTVGKLASRILGSPDIYVLPDREPNRSINFITCHDGFTLNDLVSYNVKHNEANRQNSADGANENFSWNCGVE